MSGETNSLILSIVSVVFYSVVYIPQFWTIYKKKSSEGVSIWMIMIFCLADGLSLVGSILINLSLSLIVMGWYHVFVGTLMLTAVLFFKPHKSNYEYIFVFGFIITGYVSYTLVQIFCGGAFFEVPGAIVGWMSTSMYIVGRIPQIYFNYKRKSTEGLSMTMYIFSMLGNIFYLASILAHSTENEYILSIMPWIILVVVTVLMDIFVLCQWKYYLTVSKENDIGSHSDI